MCEERIITRCNNSDVYCQLQMLITNYCLNMFRASLCPSSGEQRPCITAYGVCASSAGCGWLQLWGVAQQGSSTVKVTVRTETFTVLAPHNATPHNCNRPHAALTYLLTPWCRVLLEKLTGLQLVKKFPAFHGTRRFITALTSVRHLSLSWANPIQSIYPLT